MKMKRVFLSLIVLLIVVGFAASFFASGLAGSTASASDSDTADEAATNPTAAATDASALSPFLQSIKDNMVVSDSADENAQKIASAINVYNSLKPNDPISADGSADAFAIQKLIDMGIYFDAIPDEMQTLAWQLLVTDENGVTRVQ